MPLTTELPYCRGDVQVLHMYLLCSGVWEEDKLFIAPDLLMKNQTGLWKLQFLENFMNVEWNSLMDEAVSPSDISYLLHPHNHQCNDFALF